MRLTGLCAFPITPADEDGRIDGPALRRLLAPLIAAGVDSIGLLGSTGTYPYLARAERRHAIEAALDESNGGTPVVVGVGALRTDEAIALAQDAKAIGASAGLLAPVSYAPLTDDEVFEHFATVSHESGLPLCIYDNPTTTHFTFRPNLVARLVKIPGVMALKTASLDASKTEAHLAAFRAVVPSGFPIGYAADWTCTEALIKGADAWYSVAAGLFPKNCLAIVRAVQTGDLDRARNLDAAMHPLWQVFREFTSLRTVYAIANDLGLCRATPPRPIRMLDDAAQRKIAQVVKSLSLG